MNERSQPNCFHGGKLKARPSVPKRRGQPWAEASWQEGVLLSVRHSEMLARWVDGDALQDCLDLASIMLNLCQERVVVGSARVTKHKGKQLAASMQHPQRALPKRC